MARRISEFITNNCVNNSCDYIPYIRASGSGWDLHNYKVLGTHFTASCACTSSISLDNVMVLGTGIGSTVRCGNGNCVTGNCSTIGGGYNNLILSAENSVIGGGAGNYISSSLASTIGGGACNCACIGAFATIAGGICNVASGERSTVGGGIGNQSTCWNTVVAGGAFNCATNYYSAVGGGVCNVVNGNSSFIGGGQCNCVDGCYSLIGGGLCNYVNGLGSGVLGGQCNCVDGHYNSFIIGSNITTTANNATFVESITISTKSTGSVTPVEGQLMYDGTDLLFYVSGSWKTISHS